MKWYTPEDFREAYPTCPTPERLNIRPGVEVPLLGVLHITSDKIPYVTGTSATLRRYHDLFWLFGAWQAELYARPLFCWKAVDAATQRVKRGTVRLGVDELAVNLRPLLCPDRKLAEEFPAGELRTARLNRNGLSRQLLKAFHREALECPPEIRVVWLAMKG